MPGGIDWSLAERVATRLVGSDQISDSAHSARLESDFARLTEVAQARVEAHTGLVSPGAARARVVRREDWVRANLASYQRLLAPLLRRMDERLTGPAAAVSGRIAGAELGILLGWMSRRVLGQYDLLVLEDDTADDQDLVYYVGPNIAALERRFGFPAEEFRLWIALHEVTHRAQFTGVPWMRAHFLGLVSEMMEEAEPDPARLFTAIGRLAEAVRLRRNPLDDGGLAALFASERQMALMDQVGGLMSLLEGHGDVTMDRAAEELVPSAERFGRVLRERRTNINPAQRLLQQLLGLEAKMNQYAQGEAFIAAVEAAGGPALLNRAFESADAVPTLAEIRDPDAWVARVGNPASGGLFTARRR